MFTPQPRPHLNAVCCNTIDGGRAVLPTAELDAGKGTDTATDQLDEQCRAATNQQLSQITAPTANRARLAKKIAALYGREAPSRRQGGWAGSSSRLVRVNLGADAVGPPSQSSAG